MIMQSKKYRRIYQNLTNFELQRTSEADRLISPDDVLGDLEAKERQHLFLNFYSEYGIKKALEKYGIFNDLNKRGFHDFIIKINARDPYRHTLKAYFKQEDDDHLLGELIVRKKYFKARPIFPSDIVGKTFCMIVIEWLTLQDPTAAFTIRRPPLPGQIYPGLRIGRKILGIFVNMSLRLKTDGLLNIPQYYHNAVFYSRHFHYFNPYTQGQFLAMQRDLKKYGLFKAAWAVELGCVYERKIGKPWKWFTDEQVLFVSKRLEQYFKSKEYHTRVQEAEKNHEFKIDEQRLIELMRKKPILRDVPELFEI